jgi:hypothetical protein
MFASPAAVIVARGLNLMSLLDIGIFRIFSEPLTSILFSFGLPYFHLNRPPI